MMTQRPVAIHHQLAGHQISSGNTLVLSIDPRLLEGNQMAGQIGRCQADTRQVRATGKPRQISWPRRCVPETAVAVGSLLWLVPLQGRIRNHTMATG
jgi:hypothetical protein